MAWCSQATSHYLNQCWPRSPTPYGVTRTKSALVQVTAWCQTGKKPIQDAPDWLTDLTWPDLTWPDLTWPDYLTWPDWLTDWLTGFLNTETKPHAAICRPQERRVISTDEIQFNHKSAQILCHVVNPKYVSHCTCCHFNLPAEGPQSPFLFPTIAQLALTSYTLPRLSTRGGSLTVH